MAKEINNVTELKEATVLVNANTLKMCNAKTVDEVIEAFNEATGNLVAVFRYCAATKNKGDK